MQNFHDKSSDLTTLITVQDIAKHPTKGLFRTVGHGGDSGSIEDLERAL